MFGNLQHSSASTVHNFVEILCLFLPISAAYLLKSITGEDIAIVDAEKLTLEHLKVLNPPLVEGIRRAFLFQQRSEFSDEREEGDGEYIGGRKWYHCLKSFQTSSCRRDSYFDDYKENENPDNDLSYSWKNLSKEEIESRQLTSDTEIIQLIIGDEVSLQLPILFRLTIFQWQLTPLYAGQLVLKINWERRTFSYEYLDSGKQVMRWESSDHFSATLYATQTRKRRSSDRVGEVFIRRKQAKIGVLFRPD
jgi:hypothetical protein